MGFLLSYPVRRAVMAIVAWLFSCLAIATVLNATLEATARGAILEALPSIVNNASPEELAGRSASEFRADTLAAMERARGLHLPGPVRVLRSWLRIVSLDLGETRRSLMSVDPRPISIRKRVLEAASSTLALYVASSSIALGAGLWVALAAARRPRGRLDKALGPLGVVVSGSPTWWVGQFFVIAFAIQWRLFPFGALASIPPPENPVLAWLDRASYMVLPVASIAVVRTWGFAWLARVAMEGPLHEDYVMSARGRGIPERRVIGSHVLRTAAPAILSTGAIGLVQSFGGDALVEIVFARPGLGLLLWTSIRGNELNLTAGAFSALAFLMCASMAVVDLAYGALDPRIRLSRRV